MYGTHSQRAQPLTAAAALASAVILNKDRALCCVVNLFAFYMSWTQLSPVFVFSGSVEKEPETTEGQSTNHTFLIALFLNTTTERTSVIYFTTIPLYLITSFSLPSLSPHLSGNSAPEWVAFQEAEYKFFDHRTTWDQAQRICSWFDGALASVHSAEEEAFIANTLRKALRTFKTSSSSLVAGFYKSFWLAHIQSQFKKPEVHKPLNRQSTVYINELTEKLIMFLLHSNDQWYFKEKYYGKNLLKWK